MCQLGKGKPGQPQEGQRKGRRNYNVVLQLVIPRQILGSLSGTSAEASICDITRSWCYRSQLDQISRHDIGGFIAERAGGAARGVTVNEQNDGVFEIIPVLSSHSPRTDIPTDWTGHSVFNFLL